MLDYMFSDGSVIQKYIDISVSKPSEHIYPKRNIDAKSALSISSLLTSVLKQSEKLVVQKCVGFLGGLTWFELYTMATCPPIFVQIAWCGSEL